METNRINCLSKTDDDRIINKENNLINYSVPINDDCDDGGNGDDDSRSMLKSFQMLVRMTSIKCYFHDDDDDDDDDGYKREFW